MGSAVEPIVIAALVFGLVGTAVAVAVPTMRRQRSRRQRKVSQSSRSGETEIGLFTGEQRRRRRGTRRHKSRTPHATYDLFAGQGDKKDGE
jgi:hypothetical protein